MVSFFFVFAYSFEKFQSHIWWLYINIINSQIINFYPLYIIALLVFSVWIHSFFCIRHLLNEWNFIYPNRYVVSFHNISGYPHFFYFMSLLIIPQFILWNLYHWWWGWWLCWTRTKMEDCFCYPMQRWRR